MTADLAVIVSSFTPLTRSGQEWHGHCLQCDGPLAVIAERWRCGNCGAHEADDTALGFLRLTGLSAADAKAKLDNGTEWKPMLSKPEPPPKPYGLHRVADDPRAVLIVDDREAAKAAEEKLPRYLTVLWNGRLKAKKLEPLRGREVLIWATVEGLAKARRLEGILAGLGCTGKFIDPGGEAAPWDSDTSIIVAWAIERRRPLQALAQQETTEQPPVPVVQDAVGPLLPLADTPPAGLDLQDGAGSNTSSDAPPPFEFPPDASEARPEVHKAANQVEIYAGESIGKPASVPDWLVILERTKAGPLNNLDNVVRVIENDPTIRAHIWYDEFLDSICSDWQGPARGWRDSDDVLLQLYVQRHVGLTKIGVATVHDAALVAAFRNVRNECREWLSALEWDGTERLAHVLSDAFGAEQDTYMASVGRCWFISMVARVMEPGCKVDTVPVLEGAQGVGKSSALKIIGGKWFAECHESVLNKDWYGVLDGHMLVEISEMHSFTRGEVERVKGLISCQVDRYRKAYGRNTEDHPRQSVLVCTTNRDDWQRDDTGARRFWPVLCGALDLAYLQENRAELFAEAMHLYRAGVSWWDVPEREHEYQVERRRDADAWEPTVSAWLVGRDRITSAQIMADCLDLPTAKQDVIYQRRLARVMRALQWKQHVLRENGVNVRAWLRPRS